MQRLVRAGSCWLSLLIAIQQPRALRAQTVPEPPRPRMNIVVVEGEGTMNNIRDRKATNIVVIVRDGNRKPLPGASVTFKLPNEGASAIFSDRTTTLTVHADKDGYATAQGIQPNTVPGSYRIEIEANQNNETATAIATQFNMAVESRGGGSGKWIALIAVIGAAAAGGTVAATRGGGNGKTTVTPSVAPIGISPGTGTVGPPR